MWPATVNVEAFCGACANPFAGSIKGAVNMATRTAMIVFIEYPSSIAYQFHIAQFRILFHLGHKGREAGWEKGDGQSGFVGSHPFGRRGDCAKGLRALHAFTAPLRGARLCWAGNPRIALRFIPPPHGRRPVRGDPSPGLFSLPPSGSHLRWGQLPSAKRVGVHRLPGLRIEMWATRLFGHLA